LRPGDTLTVTAPAAPRGSDTSITPSGSASEVSDAGSATVTVVGVTVTPANRGDTTVGLLSRRLQGPPTGWLTNTPPWTEPDLRQLFDDRRLVGRTTDLLAVDEANGAVPALLAALRFTFPAAALLSACLLAVAIGSLRQGRERDVDALAAAGLDRRRGWQILLVATWATLTAGAVLGAAAALAGLWWGRSVVSAMFAQSWQTVAVPVVDIAIAAVVVPVVACGAAWLVARGGTVVGGLGKAPTSPRLAVALLVAGGAAWTLMGARVVPPRTILAYLSGLSIAGGAAIMVWAALTRSRRPALGRTLRHAAAPILALSLVLAVVSFSTAFYAAGQTHRWLATQASSNPLQPAGSLVVSGVSEQSRRTLLREYRAHGGDGALHFALPVETKHTLRVTTTRVVTCFVRSGATDPGQVLGRCAPSRSRVPVNVIALTDAPASAPVRADATLLARGRVGLLDFVVPEGTVRATAGVAARPGYGLGGNLPGAVVPAASPFASEWGLVPSGTEVLALLRFDRLQAEDQAYMRGALTRLAPTAQVQELRDRQEDLVVGLANTAAIAGSALVLLIAVVAGQALTTAQRELRQVLGLVGVRRSRRALLGARLYAIPAAVQGLAVLAALVSAWFAGVHDGSGFGWTWLSPVVVAGATFAALVRPFSAVPAAGE
jgi:hypothetical protein